MSTEIAKQEAIAKACHIFREERNKFTELYVSVDEMKVNQIKDYFGELIINVESPIQYNWKKYIRNSNRERVRAIWNILIC